MNDTLSKLRREEDKIIRNLEKRLAKGNYENFGMDELRKFKEHVLSQYLPYRVQWDFIQSLSRRIDKIQGY